MCNKRREVITKRIDPCCHPNTRTFHVIKVRSDLWGSMPVGITGEEEALLWQNKDSRKDSRLHVGFERRIIGLFEKDSLSTIHSPTNTIKCWWVSEVKASTNELVMYGDGWNKRGRHDGRKDPEIRKNSKTAHHLNSGWIVTSCKLLFGRCYMCKERKNVEITTAQALTSWCPTTNRCIGEREYRIDGRCWMCRYGWSSPWLITRDNTLIPSVSWFVSDTVGVHQLVEVMVCAWCVPSMTNITHHPNQSWTVTSINQKNGSIIVFGHHEPLSERNSASGSQSL